MPLPSLSELWEEHTAHEFNTRDAAATLETMVDDDYVNHVPVMTGGYGKAELAVFYSTDFIPKMPPDEVDSGFEDLECSPFTPEAARF